jgi:hypothetical protein
MRTPIALPRAWVASHAARAADEDEALRCRNSSPGHGRAAGRAPTLPRTAEGTVTGRRAEQIACDSQVQASPRTRSWSSPTLRSRLGGRGRRQATPILRANLAFRAVAVSCRRAPGRPSLPSPLGRHGLLVQGLDARGRVGYGVRRKKPAS